jgi:hypothetical protein
MAFTPKCICGVLTAYEFKKDHAIEDIYVGLPHVVYVCRNGTCTYRCLIERKWFGCGSWECEITDMREQLRQKHRDFLTDKARLTASLFSPDVESPPKRSKKELKVDPNPFDDEHDDVDKRRYDVPFKLASLESHVRSLANAVVEEAQFANQKIAIVDYDTDSTDETSSPMKEVNLVAVPKGSEI